MDTVFRVGKHEHRLDVRYVVFPVWPDRRTTRSSLTEGLRVGTREGPGVEGSGGALGGRGCQDPRPLGDQKTKLKRVKRCLALASTVRGFSCRKVEASSKTSPDA